MGLVGAGVGDARLVLGEFAGRDRHAGPPCQRKVSARLLTSAERAACWASALIGPRMREGWHWFGWKGGRGVRAGCTGLGPFVFLFFLFLFLFQTHSSLIEFK